MVKKYLYFVFEIFYSDFILFTKITNIEPAIQVLPEPRVISGKTANLGQMPYQVAIKDSRYTFCGGSIFNANTVLTAAHCFYTRGRLFNEKKLFDEFTFVAGK